VVDGPFLLLVGAHFLQALGYSSMLLLPLYLDHLGADRSQVGAVMAAAGIGSLAGRPLVGWGLDAVGRKPVLTVGTLILVAGMALIALVDRIGPVIWASRILVGLGGGTLFAGYFTLAADRVPVSRRTEGLALFGISGLVPLVVNPLAPSLGVEPAQLRWFLPAVGLAVLCSLIFLAGVPEPDVARSRDKVQLPAVLTALGQRALAPAWVATVVFAGGVAVFMAFATVTAEARDIGNPAACWLTYAGGAVAVRLLGARLPEQLGPNRVGAVALASYCAGFAVAAGAEHAGGFLVAGALCGVGHGYAFPIVTSQVVSRSPDQLRGVALAAFTGLWAFSGMAASPVFGMIADRFGDAAMLRTAASAGLAGLLGWLLLERAWGPGRSPDPAANIAGP
jgi:MFS family permease